MSFWAMAPSTPTIMVSPASTSSTVDGVSLREQQRLGADERVDADLGEQPGEHRDDRVRAVG